VASNSSADAFKQGLSAGLGFNIRGGIDNYHVVSDPGIFITTVKVNGAAAKDGRLQPGDKILEVRERYAGYGTGSTDLHGTVENFA
jgi:C-terminal processing protease CtpA/Prc